MRAIKEFRHAVAAIVIIAIAISSFIYHENFHPQYELFQDAGFLKKSYPIFSTWRNLDISFPSYKNSSSLILNPDHGLEPPWHHHLERRVITFDQAITKGERTLSLVNGRCAQRSPWSTVQHLTENGWTLSTPDNDWPPELNVPFREKRIPTGKAVNIWQTASQDRSFRNINDEDTAVRHCCSKPDVLYGAANLSKGMMIT